VLLAFCESPLLPVHWQLPTRYQQDVRIGDRLVPLLPTYSFALNDL